MPKKNGSSPKKKHLEDNGHPNHSACGVVILAPRKSPIQELVEALSPGHWLVQAHGDLDSLLEEGLPPHPSCLLLDSDLNENGRGLEVLTKLQERHWNLPTILVSDDWDLEFVVNAMRAGADGFLADPVNPEELRDALDHALTRACEEHYNGSSEFNARVRVASLNARESEIVSLVIRGMLNKEIADHLNLALVTIKLYRARAMKKLGAGNPAEMVNIAILGGLNFDQDGKQNS